MECFLACMAVADEFVVAGSPSHGMPLSVHRAAYACTLQGTWLQSHAPTKKSSRHPLSLHQGRAWDFASGWRRAGWTLNTQSTGTLQATKSAGRECCRHTAMHRARNAKCYGQGAGADKSCQTAMTHTSTLALSAFMSDAHGLLPCAASSAA